jgi:hypothetical protein
MAKAGSALARLASQSGFPGRQVTHRLQRLPSDLFFAQKREARD